MDTFKRRMSQGSTEHNEKATSTGIHARRLSAEDIINAQHREDDDRTDAAKGRNADQMDRKYWLSVNYIGTMFAIGMAFMGGIGGTFLLLKHLG